MEPAELTFIAGGVIPPERFDLKDNAGSLGNCILTLGHKHIGGKKGMNMQATPQGDLSTIEIPVSVNKRLANIAKTLANLGTPGTPLP